MAEVPERRWQTWRAIHWSGHDATPAWPDVWETEPEKGRPIYGPKGEVVAMVQPPRPPFGFTVPRSGRGPGG